MYVEAVGGIRQLHAVGRDSRWSNFYDGKSRLAQTQRDRIGVQADVFQHHRVAVADQLMPVLALRGALRCLIQGEIDTGLVAADQPAPLPIQQAVVRVVLVIILAWCQANPVSFGFIR